MYAITIYAVYCVYLTAGVLSYKRTANSNALCIIDDVQCIINDAL